LERFVLKPEARSMPTDSNSKGAKNGQNSDKLLQFKQSQFSLKKWERI